MTSLADRTSGYLRVLRVPILLVLAAVTLLAGYYAIYVRDRADYLTGRNLRLVANLGRQIEASLADHETVLASFSHYYGPDLFVNRFSCIAELARPYVRLFEYVSLAGGPARTPAAAPSCDSVRTFTRADRPVATALAAPVLFVEPDTGVTWARRTNPLRRPEERRFLVPVGDVLDTLLAPYARDGVFDAVVLATTAGRIVYQAAGSDVRLATFNRLATRQSDGTSKELDFNALPLAPQVLDVELSGGRYKIYLQPCCVQLAEGAVANDRAGWMVAGLIDAGAVRAESLAISFSMMALIGAAILAAIFSWPFLKVMLIGEGQRLRLIDVLLVGVCALLGVSLITLAIVDWAAYSSFKSHVDRQLEALSADVRRNLARELGLARRQLRDLESLANEAPAPDRTADLLPRLRAVPYPFMESFTLIDADGMQTRKWAAAGFTTPRISTRHRAYFQHWVGPHPERPDYFLESIRSGTTGRKQAVLSRAAAGAGAAVAALTIPVVSLTDALLPPGFGFAVIDEGGTVLFHSDASHSLDEQFFLETDRDRRLRAAVAARRAELVNVRYLGSDHRAYVAPIDEPQGARWSLVTFADKQAVRTINIEWLLITLLLTVIYVGIYVALCIAVIVWRPDYRAAWIWPDPARQRLYQQLIVSYLGFGVAFAWAVYGLRDRLLLSLALLLPFLVWTATYVTLMRRGRAPLSRRFASVLVGVAAGGLLLWLLRENAATALGVTAFVLLAFVVPAAGARLPLVYPYRPAATLLLALTAVLPTLAFFKVAHAIQVESFVKHAQLHLARDLQGRADAVKHEVAALRVDGTPTADAVMSLRRELSVYDDFFFDTETSVGGAATACETGAAGSPVSIAASGRSELPKSLEEMLPYYSESSVGMRELLHDASSDGAWNWRRTAGHLTLQARVEERETACVRSGVPGVFTMGAGSSGAAVSSLVRVVPLGGTLLLLVAWIARFFARRVLLIDLVEPLWSGGAAGMPMHPGTHLYVRWRAADRRGRRAAEDGRCLIDFADGRAGGESWFVERRRCLEEEAAGRTIVVDHLEDGVDDAGFNKRKLALINEAIDVQHLTIVLVSALTPGVLVRRIADADEGAAAAWTALLSRVTTIDGARLTPMPSVIGTAGAAVNLGEGSAPPGAVDGANTQAQLGAAPARAGLSEAGVPVADALPARSAPPGVSLDRPAVESVLTEVARAVTSRQIPVPLNRDQLDEEVAERLGNYHQGIWTTCSDAEKRLLLHLAQDGFANEKDRRTVRVLLARGLLRKSPNLQFTDATFHQFVLSRALSAEAGALEPERDSAWDNIRMPFLAVVLGISAFFFLTQRELFTTTMAVITALAGGIPAAVRVLGLFEQRTGQSPH